MSLIKMDFYHLIQIQSLVYAMVVAVICISAVKLRISEPGYHRPYKIFNSDALWLVVIVAAGPTLLSLYIVVTVVISNWTYGVVLVGLWLLCLIWHGICGFRRELEDMGGYERSFLINDGKQPTHGSF